MKNKPQTRTEARARHAEIMARLEALESGGPLAEPGAAVTVESATELLMEMLALVDCMLELPPESE